MLLQIHLVIIFYKPCTCQLWWWWYPIFLNNYFLHFELNIITKHNLNVCMLLTAIANFACPLGFSHFKLFEQIDFFLGLWSKSSLHEIMNFCMFLSICKYTFLLNISWALMSLFNFAECFIYLFNYFFKAKYLAILLYSRVCFLIFFFFCYLQLCLP